MRDLRTPGFHRLVRDPYVDSTDMVVVHVGELPALSIMGTEGPPVPFTVGLEELRRRGFVRYGGQVHPDCGNWAFHEGKTPNEPGWYCLRVGIPGVSEPQPTVGRIYRHHGGMAAQYIDLRRRPRDLHYDAHYYMAAFDTDRGFLTWGQPLECFPDPQHHRSAP